MPCETPDCQACADGVSWRWHAYVGLFNPKTLQHAIFELTAMPAQTLVEMETARQSLRGLLLEANRPGSRRNGRVYVTLRPNDDLSIVLPPEPDLVTMLCRIWNVPKTAALEAARQWNTTTIAIDSGVTAANNENAAGPTERRREPKREAS
jgi:hypothetical protein